MPANLTIPSTNGGRFESYPERGKRGVIIERASLTAGSSYYTIKTKLPSRCRVLMSSLKVLTAVGLAHSGASGTSVLCDTFALCNALPTTNATSATTTMVMAVSATGATSTATTGASRSITAGTNETDARSYAGEQLTAANAYNSASSEVTLYLVPMDTGGSEDFNIATTPTEGYNFGTTATVDVQVWYEELKTTNANTNG